MTMANLAVYHVEGTVWAVFIKLVGLVEHLSATERGDTRYFPETKQRGVFEPRRWGDAWGFKYDRKIPKKRLEEKRGKLGYLRVFVRFLQPVC
jgi:hypothetical protein